MRTWLRLFVAVTALTCASHALAAPGDAPNGPFAVLSRVFSNGGPPAEPSPPAIAAAPALPATGPAALPPSKAATPVAGPVSPAPPPAPAALVSVPKPRLRPVLPGTTASVVASAKPTAVMPAGPSVVDRVVTGAIDPAPLAPPTPAAQPIPPTPAPLPPAAAPSPAAAVATPVADVPSDGLLGDPTTTFPVPPAVAPDAPQPQAITLPRPGVASTGVAPLPPAAGDEPYQRLRQLQLLQDQTAKGSIDALAAQRALIAAMDRAFNAADAKVWSDARNALAAVAFVLSGGPPTILAKLATLDPKPAVDERLVTGVLAYSQGKESAASTAIGAIDATTLPASIAAQIAMAQSALAARTDPDKAMQLLSLARLLAPGTLVEEAAIRRQIFVADQLRQDAMIQSLARQYLDRFRHSVYAGNFRDRFAAALTHMDFVNDPAQFSRVDDMLASVEPDARAEFYLTIALAGTVGGRTNEASLAAARALSLTPPGTPSQSRAHLYRAAALVASAKTFDAAVAEFTAIDRSQLNASDKSLADAVGATVAAIRSGTEVTVATGAPSAAPATPDQPSAVMTRATASLKTIDDLLAKAAL